MAISNMNTGVLHYRRRLHRFAELQDGMFTNITLRTPAFFLYIIAD